ncbi:hypothetical protein BdWA1_002485 [Babesia duncani]|uniref:Uncharacterized protein n=1 Tax=Babesia duncani TaxID=323732 RepID=A0AAD9PK27_9APIC|nr:hypothetical protein BdWA1_002485 [Babesia duncani]
MFNSRKLVLRKESKAQGISRPSNTQTSASVDYIEVVPGVSCFSDNKPKRGLKFSGQNSTPSESLSQNAKPDHMTFDTIGQEAYGVTAKPGLGPLDQSFNVAEHLKSKMSTLHAQVVSCANSITETRSALESTRQRLASLEQTLEQVQGTSEPFFDFEKFTATCIGLHSSKAHAIESELDKTFDNRIAFSDWMCRVRVWYLLDLLYYAGYSRTHYTSDLHNLVKPDGFLQSESTIEAVDARISRVVEIHEQWISKCKSLHANLTCDEEIDHYMLHRTPLIPPFEQLALLYNEKMNLDPINDKLMENVAPPWDSVKVLDKLDHFVDKCGAELDVNISQAFSCIYCLYQRLDLLKLDPLARKDVDVFIPWKTISDKWEINSPMSSIIIGAIHNVCKSWSMDSDAETRQLAELCLMFCGKDLARDRMLSHEFTNVLEYLLKIYRIPLVGFKNANTTPMEESVRQVLLNYYIVIACNILTMQCIISTEAAYNLVFNTVFLNDILPLLRIKCSRDALEMLIFAFRFSKLSVPKSWGEGRGTRIFKAKLRIIAETEWADTEWLDPTEYTRRLDAMGLC